jgi:hypothetical protein
MGRIGFELNGEKMLRPKKEKSFTCKLEPEENDTMQALSLAPPFL